MNKHLHRIPQRYFQFSFNLLLALTLVLGAFAAQPPDRARAAVAVVAGWPYQGWTASEGSLSNTSGAGAAVLSTNTSNSFFTANDIQPGPMNQFISDNWVNGSGTKYWKVRFNSTAFQNLTVSSQQMSTDLDFYGWDGPRDFKLQYSLNDSNWTDVANSTLTMSGSWTTGGKLTNLPLPMALNNQPNVYLRWIMTSNNSVGTNGFTNSARNNIGGIYIYGDEIPTAPTDISLSNTTFYSGSPVGSLVGNLSVTDVNQSDTWTYSLVSGTGSTNNGSFTITGNKLTTNALLTPGTYSIRVNVFDGTYNFAKVFTITVTGYQSITGGNTQYNDYITNVTFAGINNASDGAAPHPGYQDFKAITGTVRPGMSYPLSTTVNVGCPNPPVAPDCGGVTYPQYIKVWFDWNKDGDFADEGEAVNINTNTLSNGPHTVTVNVPITATPGATLMRIVNSADGDTDQNPPEPPSSGTTSFYGQAEDYTINVIALTITTGAISGSPFYVSASQGASVSVPYTIAGDYTAGNVFTAYLSDASGSFASETAIGARTATDAGTITATIPAGKASGTGYRIRVKSSTPAVTGTDNGSNVSIILDTTAPVVTVPANQTVEATGPNGAVYSFTATAADTAPLNPAVTCTPASGSPFPFGPTTVNCTATDSAGNTGSNSFTVTVRDTTSPAITVPANQTIEAAGPSGAVYTFTAAATDLVAPANPTVSCTPASGSTFPLGATTVTCNAADAAGNPASKTFTVTVQDKTAPVVTVPANATLEAAGPTGAVHTFAATATDSVAPANPSVTCSPASGSTFPLGVTTVTCTAADSAGNTGSSSFTVTVRDTTKPVVTVPSNAAVEAAGPSGAVYTFAATATDLVAPANPTVTCTPASGSTFPLGATTVTCTARDTAGNTGTNTFTVTVRDTTAPLVVVPSSVTLEATGPSGAAHTFTATATDLVAPVNPTVSCTPASGSTFPLGDTTVTCTAADIAGNTGSNTFTVTVQDKTAPVLTVPASATVEATGPSGAAYTFIATASDLVAPLNPAVTCVPASGATFPLGATTVTCTTADTAGNPASKTFTVTVQDKTGPAVTVPANAAVEATGPTGAVYTFTASATDLVAPANPTVTCLPASGSTFPLGATTVTCSAADTAGNASSSAFTVTVQDTTAPVVTVPANVSIEVPEEIGAAHTFTATAADLVGPASPTVTCAPPSGSTFPFGSTTVTCTATDSAGNTGTGTFTVTVWKKIRYYLGVIHR